MAQLGLNRLNAGGRNLDQMAVVEGIKPEILGRLLEPVLRRRDSNRCKLKHWKQNRWFLRFALLIHQLGLQQAHGAGAVLVL